jgi:hypothetical protein
MLLSLPLVTSATFGIFYQPRVMDNDERGAVCRMRIGKGNRNVRIKLPQYHFIDHIFHLT